MAVEAEVSMAAQGCWSSLPGDLVNRIADCLLATDDLDYYMDLRAVCQHWRSTTADPRSKINQHDPRFRPSRWVLLDERKISSSTTRDDDGDDTVLFVNTATGRFLRKSLRPFLHRHRYDFVTTTTGGLLLLAARDSTPGHAARVLNPFTGSLLRFAAPLPDEYELIAEVVGPSPTLVMVSVSSSDVYWAEPQSESFSMEHHHNCPDSSLPLLAAAKCTHIPVRDRNVTVTFEDRLSSQGCRCYAVLLPFSAGGDMLAVLKCRRLFAVFKIDAAGNVKERVTSIGNLAVFLGVRCLAVDADCLPTIEPNSIYFQGRSDLFVYKVDIIGTNEDQEPKFVEDAAGFTRLVVEKQFFNFGAAYWGAPLTVTQTLVTYTMDHHRYRPWGMELSSCRGCSDYWRCASELEDEYSTDEDWDDDEDH